MPAFYNDTDRRVKRAEGETGASVDKAALRCYNFGIGGVMTHLGNDWDEILAPPVESGYMAQLRDFLNAEYRSARVYPPKRQILAAFEYTSYEDAKVVILGQDPYHGYGQANGLCFSVGEGVACPPSLVNIYKALEYDLGIKPTDCGDLRGWAKQGVLLLNSVLTVREGRPQSHAGKGWERFTDEVVKLLAAREKPLVFMLWGGYAKRKGAVIDKSRHLVLESVHPSPLSFYQGFLECRHFSKANAFLEEHGQSPVNWAARSLSEYEKLETGRS